MKETILKLKTMLPAAEFIMTGSYVLSQYGLHQDRVDDLDIILVKPEPATVELINRFMKDFPAKSTAKFQALKIPEVKEDAKYAEEPYVEPCKLKDQAMLKNSACCQAIFMFDNQKIDIFIEDYFSEPVLILDGIKCTTIPHIISAKRKYGRMKDWLQCRDMAKLIFDAGVFNEILNTSWKNLMRDDY